jgi:hypothetical protein
VRQAGIEMHPHTGRSRFRAFGDFLVVLGMAIIERFASGSFIPSAIFRASLARSSQCSGVPKAFGIAPFPSKCLPLSMPISGAAIKSSEMDG